MNNSRQLLNVILESKVDVKMTLDQARDIAREVTKLISPYCEKIVPSGSLRRKEKQVGDIDLVVIPKDVMELAKYIKKLDSNATGGLSNLYFVYKGTKFNIFVTNRESLGATLIWSTGPVGGTIGRQALAKRKGMKMSRHGIFIGTEKIAGKTEKEMYTALGKPYKKPTKR